MVYMISDEEQTRQRRKGRQGREMSSLVVVPQVQQLEACLQYTCNKGHSKQT